MLHVCVRNVCFALPRDRGGPRIFRYFLPPNPTLAPTCPWLQQVSQSVQHPSAGGCFYGGIPGMITQDTNGHARAACASVTCASAEIFSALWSCADADPSRPCARAPQGRGACGPQGGLMGVRCSVILDGSREDMTGLARALGAGCELLFVSHSLLATYLRTGKNKRMRLHFNQVGYSIYGKEQSRRVPAVRAKPGNPGYGFRQARWRDTLESLEDKTHCDKVVTLLPVCSSALLPRALFSQPLASPCSRRRSSPPDAPTTRSGKSPR